ncbi:MAG: PEP-CTERM sorting domain-containing protein [Akkermansiaceae bacterium]
MNKTVKNTLLCLASTFSVSHAAVTVGDLAIIGYYTDGNSNGPGTGDAFSWVALNDISQGEVLYFSDASYYDDTSAFRAEGLIRLTVGAGGISAGTIHSVEAGNLLSGYTHLPNTAYSEDVDPSLTPASSGDQLVIFQDSNVADTLGFTALWALTTSTTDWNAVGVTGVGVGGFPPDQNDSNLYPGLTDGTNAIALGNSATKDDEWDNVRYTGSTAGSAQDIRASILNTANWEKTNDSDLSPVTWVDNGASSFTVVPEPSSAALISLATLLGFAHRRRN